ncbi:MAG: HIT domain-containing protein [Candidatus Omnitrophica bacterium]|nr:HIT domain-containing protein [Candidatus Omnitrophota bacterium]
MDNLWAPWRTKYILGNKKEKKCLFCNMVRNKKRNAYVVLKTKEVFSLLNIYPYNNGHIMVVPKRHIDSIERISPSEWQQMHFHIRAITSALRKILKPDGFNIGINIGKVAGAGVDKHLHIHIVPRWEGDTNFMPVISQTKVISQSLKELYKSLRAAIEKEK